MDDPKILEDDWPDAYDTIRIIDIQADMNSGYWFVKFERPDNQEIEQWVTQACWEPCILTMEETLKEEWEKGAFRETRQSV